LFLITDLVACGIVDVKLFGWSIISDAEMNFLNHKGVLRFVPNLAKTNGSVIRAIGEVIPLICKGHYSFNTTIL
jgi:hypothetical protein